jgi:hypothetical protein
MVAPAFGALGPGRTLNVTWRLVGGTVNSLPPDRASFTTTTT